MVRSEDSQQIISFYLLIHIQYSDKNNANQGKPSPGKSEGAFSHQCNKHVFLTALSKFLVSE